MRRMNEDLIYEELEYLEDLKKCGEDKYDQEHTRIYNHCVEDLGRSKAAKVFRHVQKNEWDEARSLLNG